MYSLTTNIPLRPILAVQLVILLCFAVTCYFFGIVIYNVFFHPLRKYPGPRLWAATRIPFAMTSTSGRSHEKVLQLHQTYGSVVRVAPDELSFNSPEAWNDIMGHRKRGQEEYGKDPDFWKSQKHSVISANRENHSRMRRVLSHGFSAQAMLAQQPLIQSYVSLLIEKLHDACDGGSAPLEMTSWYNWTTFDIIGDLAFGEPFGCLQDSAYHPWVSLIFDRIRGNAINAVLRKYPCSDLLIRMLVSKEAIRRFRAHFELTKEKVAQRLALEDGRHDFMEVMVNTRESLKLSYPEILDNSSLLIIAGSETTATTLSAVTYFLATHKEVMNKLAEEVRSIFNSEDEIDLLSVQKLSYMMAVLNETLRIFPPVPTAIPRKAPAGGDTIQGQYVPAGTIIGIWQWPMYHNPENFSLPHSFIPERWLDDPRFDQDRKEGFQPFSFGPRNCLGKNLAFAEMRLILARIVWNFDMSLDARSEGWLQRNRAFTLWMKPNLYIYLTPRRTA
ncbi:cytochrome P450 [Dactylonectria macrodidyma]|uniref:Cytochrome P450 n=1 Tax=Dactylonectria macrodidyma TaxID=307937 RepID=A0A9P9J1L5_9HYPO|nr:cytochrome P450 [Dactylonectria macrodidyma]